jgi:hypothetical protein
MSIDTKNSFGFEKALDTLLAFDIMGGTVAG